MVWSRCVTGGSSPKLTIILISAAVFSFQLVSGRREGRTLDTGNGTNSTTNETNCSLASESPFAECPYPTACEDYLAEGESGHSGKHIGLAFGLTIGAGLATTLGAFFPFIPLVKRSNTAYLAAALGLAAGVMLYVSFTEIWEETKINFCCETPHHYELAASLCFFGGIVLTVALDALVWALEKIDCGCRCFPPRRKSRARRFLGEAATDKETKVLRAVNPLSLFFKKTGAGCKKSRDVIPSVCAEGSDTSNASSSAEMVGPVAASAPLGGPATLAPAAGCCCGEGEAPVRNARESVSLSSVLRVREAGREGCVELAF